MRTKIWSAEDGSCPVTLTGHTAAVTQTGEKISERNTTLKVFLKIINNSMMTPLDQNFIKEVSSYNFHFAKERDICLLC